MRGEAALIGNDLYLPGGLIGDGDPDEYGREGLLFGGNTECIDIPSAARTSARSAKNGARWQRVKTIPMLHRSTATVRRRDFEHVCF